MDEIHSRNSAACRFASRRRDDALHAANSAQMLQMRGCLLSLTRSSTRWSKRVQSSSRPVVQSMRADATNADATNSEYAASASWQRINELEIRRVKKGIAPGNL